MIGRRATVGFSLLCALMFSALVVQSASAQVGTKAVNTTAVTCVFGGGSKDFKDAHCDEFVGAEKGSWGHVSIAKDTTTEIEVASEGSSKFNGVIAGVNTEFICNKAASVKEKSFIHNVESEKKHTVTGTVQLSFTECKVEKPANCKIKEPLVFTATFEGVEGVNEDTKNEMGLEFRGEGENKAFAEFKFEGEKCALKPALPVLQGSAIATGKTATQKEKQSGATWVFEPGFTKNKMETLEMSVKFAEFTGVFTPRMAGGGNPISFTTVT